VQGLDAEPPKVACCDPSFLINIDELTTYSCNPEILKDSFNNGFIYFWKNKMEIR